MKTICIYHSRDLDGWMSAAIVKRWYLELYLDENTQQISENKDKIVIQMTLSEEISDTLEFLGWDYRDEIPDLSDYDKIIMCDVSFPHKTMLDIINKLTWIDHHQSVIKDNKILFDLEVYPSIKGLINTKYAACELTWKYFFPNEEMPEIVRLLGRWDNMINVSITDKKEWLKVTEFQYGARQEIKDYEEAYWYLTTNTMYDLENNISMTDSILEKGQFIYEYLCTEAKQIYNKAFEINFNNDITSALHKVFPNNTIKVNHYKYKFLCVNQERFNPINFGIDYHKEGYDGFACFWYKDSKWTFSLYNDNGNVDCSIIAKQYGGGGHKGASGFVCDNKTMLKIINNK